MAYRWDKKVQEMAKAERRAMVKIVIDRRYVDDHPTGGSMMVEGAVSVPEERAVAEVFFRLVAAVSEFPMKPSIEPVATGVE